MHLLNCNLPVKSSDTSAEAQQALKMPLATNHGTSRNCVHHHN